MVPKLPWSDPCLNIRMTFENSTQGKMEEQLAALTVTLAVRYPNGLSRAERIFATVKECVEALPASNVILFPVKPRQAPHGDVYA